jgi:hypothetical protein
MIANTGNGILKGATEPEPTAMPLDALKAATSSWQNVEGDIVT